MRSQYYKKDKKAQIYKHREISIDGDMPKEKYYPVRRSPLWCYTSQLSQDRIYAAMGVGARETRFFVFNHLKDIMVNDAILYRGNWYNITRVDTQDDYNTDTFVYVENMSTTPSEDDILSYDKKNRYI